MLKILRDKNQLFHSLRIWISINMEEAEMIDWNQEFSVSIVQ